MSMTALIILSAIVLLSCTILKRVSARIGVPTLLLFILLGMVFGSDGLVNIPFDDYAFAEKAEHGGAGNHHVLRRLRHQLERPQSLWLSCRSCSPASAPSRQRRSSACFGYAVLGMPLLEGMLCGALLSSTDAASVFSILRSRNLALKGKHRLPARS